MANLCQTFLHIRGNKEDLEDLKKHIENIKDAGYYDLYALIDDLGGNSNQIACRASVEFCDFYANQLEVQWSGAWDEQRESIDFLIKHYNKRISIVYQAYEPMCGYFVSNDKEGIDFPERYMLMTDDTSGWDEEAHNTFNDLANTIEDLCGQKPKDETEAKELAEKNEWCLITCCIID